MKKPTINAINEKQKTESQWKYRENNENETKKIY